MCRRYGKKMYKLALDGGMTCPNRDGTLDTRGCIFCSGSGEFAAKYTGDVTDQIQQAKRLVGSKAKNAGFIGYFQSYTNTYAPVDRLRALYMPVLEHPDIEILDIATRPDCLEPEVLELLGELNRKKPIWVELGLQTIHPETARWIRRGYDLPVFDEAVKHLKGIGVEVIVHQILGLPGETAQQMYDTASYIGHSGADGVKFHLLHVLKGTDLAESYAAGDFQTLTLETYIDLLAGCIARIPREMVVHRITGDGDKRTLIAPMWSGDKKRVLNAIQKSFVQRDLEQGSLFA